MDKAKFKEEMNRAKERIYSMRETAGGKLSIKEHIDEYLISYALLNMSDGAFQNALKKAKEKAA